MRIHLLQNILLSNFQSTQLNFPFLSLFKMLSVCFSLLPSCEILSGKHVRIPVSGGLFPRESQLSGTTQTDWMGQSVRLRARCPSAHPFLVILLPSFFSLPYAEIVLLTSVGPSLFPAIKTGPGGRRCLENVVIIAHTHTRRGPSPVVW